MVVVVVVSFAVVVDVWVVVVEVVVVVGAFVVVAVVPLVVLSLVVVLCEAERAVLCEEEAVVPAAGAPFPPQPTSKSASATTAERIFLLIYVLLPSKTTRTDGYRISIETLPDMCYTDCGYSIADRKGKRYLKNH